MRRARVVAAIGHALPWAIAVGYFFAAPSDLDFGTQVMIWILFAMSLDLALGYAGILTLGQAAFFGLGAYTAGLFAIHLSPDPLLGHLAAIGVAALVGALTGAMILHTTGVTLLMLTLAIVSVLSQYANQATDLTGGDNGLQGIRLDPIFGVFEFISAAMAGSAGALSAHATRFVGLSVLDLLTSGTVTVALILGGTRRLYGGFIGATIYLVVQDYSAKISPFFWEFVVGGLLIATVLLLEGGLLDLGPAVLRLCDRWQAGQRK